MASASKIVAMEEKSDVDASTTAQSKTPRKTEQGGSSEGHSSKETGQEEKRGEDEKYEEEPSPSPKSRKRKDDEHEQPKSTPPPSKVARKDNRVSDETAESSHKQSKPSSTQVLKSLLSPESLHLTIPESERDLDDDIRIYATAHLAPFEELLSAVVLSRPISHKLGQRTIRTLLNDPYKLTTPGAVREAGQVKVLQALWDAKTQHKDKTAEEIVGLVDVLLDQGEDADDGSLKKVRHAAGNDVQEERKWLKEHIKGVGPTGLDIFCRRVQAEWGEVFPFVDGRTGQALEELGLPGKAEELGELLEEQWEELGINGIRGQDQSEENRRRRAFVLVLERAVGASLEKNVERVLSEAAKI